MYYKAPRNAKPFVSPSSFEIKIKLSDGSYISGMGIKGGITVILGDAYQGKSTLLSAICEGIYNHVYGDGREYVITLTSAVYVKSESGRSIQNTDISFYLKKVPTSVCNAKNFSTDSASGSTSQAAAVAEAVESGCKLMLFDEDSSANNFMYKEKAIQEILGKQCTAPFLENSQVFYSQYGISSIFMAGASAEYLGAADNVLLIENYQIHEYTKNIRVDIKPKTFNICARFVNWSKLCTPDILASITVIDTNILRLGSAFLNIGNIMPNISIGQMHFIERFLKWLFTYKISQGKTLPMTLDLCYAEIDQNYEKSYVFSGESCIEYVRKYDIMQILYRCKIIRFARRSLKVFKLSMRTCSI